MKILVGSNLFPPHYVGGYALRCEVAVTALRARGPNVRVLTSNHGVTGAPAGGTQNGVARTLRIHGFFGHPRLNIRGLRELELPNNRVLPETIASFRPDVVHVWNLGGISKSLCLTLQQLGVPTVYDVSDHGIARSLVADVWLDWWNRPNPALPARLLPTGWTLTGARSRWSQTAPTNPVTEVRFPRSDFCSAALRDLTAAKGRRPARRCDLLPRGPAALQRRADPRVAPAAQVALRRSSRRRQRRDDCAQSHGRRAGEIRR